MSSESDSVVVVDSSVAYKWFDDREESCVPEALELLEAHRTGNRLLAGPAHLPADVLNGLRFAGLGQRYLRGAAAKLDAAEIALFPLDGQLLTGAIDIALAHDLTIHDALFCALAVALDCELVTADRKQAQVTECRVRHLC